MNAQLAILYWTQEVRTDVHHARASSSSSASPRLCPLLQIRARAVRPQVMSVHRPTGWAPAIVCAAVLSRPARCSLRAGYRAEE